MKKKQAVLTSVGATVAMVASLFVGTASADPGADVVLDEELEAAPVASADVTESVVGFVDGSFAPEYLEAPAIAESVGDALQLDAVKVVEESSAEDIDKLAGFVARVDLESDNVTVGATWDLNSPTPSQVKFRYLSDGVWSSWDDLEFIDEDNEYEGAVRAGTDPYSLANADAFEAVALTEEGEAIPSLELTVIDAEGLAPVENVLEKSDAEEPQSADQEDLSSEVDLGDVDELNEAESSDEPGDQDSAEGGAEFVEEDRDDIESGLGGADGSESDTLRDQLGNEDPAEGDQDNLAELALVEVDGAMPAQPVSLNAAQTQFDTGFHGLKIKTRKGWGANESLRKGFVDDKITYKGAVIHHTAGNNNYNQQQVPGQIQGIYYYHAVTLGWGDVGYQLLVDKFGGVWEGRYGSLTRSQQGAQAYGANKQTFGISVLGDYTSAAPSAAAQDSVAKTVGWMFTKWGISNPNGSIWVPGSDQRGRTVSTVSGHRDIGTTACPGNAFYAQMPSIRSKISAYMSSYNVPRISGSDRTTTAVAVSKHQFPKGAKTAYLVNKGRPVDAIVAGIVTDGPILYTSKSSIPAATLTEMKRLGVSTVTAIGGSGVIDSNVLSIAKSHGFKTSRLGGEDRIATAIKVSQHVFPGKASAVYVADQLGPERIGSPDAVAGANLQNGPILLNVTGGSVDARVAKEIRRLGGKVYELGGAKLGVGGAKIAGSDRYKTAAEIARHAYGSKPSTVYLVRGDDPVDAVAAGTLTAGPRLLVHPTITGSVPCAYLRSAKPSKILVIGGAGAVSARVYHEAKACAG